MKDSIKKRNKTVSLRVTADVYAELDKLEQSKSKYLRRLIWEDVKKQDSLLKKYAQLERAIDQSRTTHQILNTIENYERKLEKLDPYQRQMKLIQYVNVLKAQRELLSDKDVIRLLDSQLERFKTRSERNKQQLKEYAPDDQ
jgi:hypothetical protein